MANVRQCSFPGVCFLQDIWSAAMNPVSFRMAGPLIAALVVSMPAARGAVATSVSAGFGHSCAVVDGGVQCWGKNSNGELGNNSTTQSLVPVQTIPALSNVTAVAAGGNHLSLIHI